MPQLDRGAFEGSELARVHSQSSSAREVRVPVFETDDSLFRTFINAAYDSHVYKWEATHPVGSFTVTREEWMKYAFTALRSRLARVNDDPGQIRSDDEWQIPSMIASVLNAVGKVTIDAPAMQYTPVWNKAYDNMVFTKPEWARVTAKLRALAADRDNAKFVFVRSLAGDRSGDRMIMDLIPVRDSVGKIVRLHANQPVDGVAAFVYLAMGFAPEVYANLTLEVHPRALPGRYLDSDVVEYGATELGLRSA
jgi:hypothetical protein